MELVDAKGKALLIRDDGLICGPESLFLTTEYDNVHSRTKVSLALRLLHVFTRCMSIDFPERAMNGTCLHAPEVGWLSNLAYRPVEELESMNSRMLLRLAKSESPPHRDRKGAVAATTARAKLRHIADFLDWYLKKVLEPRIRSAQARVELKERYDNTVRELKNKIRKGAGKHPTQVRSLPSELFIRIIRQAFVNPETVFCSERGTTSQTAQRDRAIFLLACEGLRPGAIGNLALQDFFGNQLRITDNAKKREHSITEGTPVQKGIRSSIVEYNSELTITLWPWTVTALRDYINGERNELLSRRLSNTSRGFLFLESQHGKPIANRKTIGLVFRRAVTRLLQMGHLNRQSSDPHIKTESYELTAYTLRHSSATLYVERKGDSDKTLSDMKNRFGWTAKSDMPSLYARRANMDAAGVDLEELWNSLKAERESARAKP